MVHKAKDDAHVGLWPRRLQDRPHLAVLIGVIASEWAMVESNMTFLYGTLLGKYLPHDRSQGPPVHPIGAQIFETLPNQHQRTELIRKLVNTLITDGQLLAALADLLETLKTASAKRNDCVHADWGLNDEQYPNELLKIRAPGEFLVYAESDFNEVINIIIAAGDAVIKFENEVIKYFKTVENPM